MKKKAIHREAQQAFEPFAALGAVLVLVVMLAMLFLARPIGAETVTLRPEALVKGPSIVLGDIADIEGDKAAELGAIEIGTAAPPGVAKRFSSAILASRLKTAGFDPANVEVGGAKMVNAVTLSNEVSRADLVSSLRDYILANMPWKPEDAEIDVPQPLDDVVVPDGKMSITWHANPQYHYLGAGGFRADVTVNGKVEHTVMMRANISAYTQVLVAKNDVQRGASVRPQDFELRKEQMLNATADYLTSTDALAGQIAKKSLFPGQVVKSSDFEAPQVIKRNQLVNVETRAGILSIQSQAVAMNDARVGDVLTCSNPTSSQNFQGVVRKDGTVVVQ